MRLFPSPPADLPFFPSILGMTGDKEIIVERIEAAMAMLGLPILGRNGKRLYGGHAFRVAGARFLSRMGIEIRIVALLGRWGL